MFLELALVLPIYAFWYGTLSLDIDIVIKAMTSLDNLLSNIYEEFDGVVDTLEEGVAQQRKTLKDAIQYGKVHLLPGKKETN